MRLAEGVHLHFIENKKFKTQRIKIRFSAPMEKRGLAGRVLLAYLLETANKPYPKPQLFRQHLAGLYGATFDTSLSKKGSVHILDIDVSYLAPSYLSGKDLTKSILDFVKSALFEPLTQADGFEPQFFKLEKENLISYLETEAEDNFYQAQLAIHDLFYQSELLSLPKQARLDLVNLETPQSVFRAFKKMLTQDRIDIFCLGQFDQELIENYCSDLNFTDRFPQLQFQCHQDFSNVVLNQVEKKEANQSILELAYQVEAPYASKDFFTLLVMNGLLGAFSHSRLFSIIREKEGLAYSIGSQFDSLTSYLNIYVGIDKGQRKKVMRLVHQQWMAFKQGQISFQELQQTKLALKNNLLLAEDRQVHLIEQVYNNSVFEGQCFQIDRWLTEIDKVSKEDVSALARTIKLQAIYFMEASL